MKKVADYVSGDDCDQAIMPRDVDLLLMATEEELHASCMGVGEAGKTKELLGDLTLETLVKNAEAVAIPAMPEGFRPTMEKAVASVRQRIRGER